MTASSEAPTEVMMLFSKRLMNSVRGVEISNIVSGDRPSERQPFQFGMKSTKGMMWPGVTSPADWKDVVTVQ